MSNNTANSKQRYLGIDLGGTSIKYGRVTSEGVIECQDKTPTCSEKGREALLGKLGDVGEELIKGAQDLDFEVSYLGLVAPGAVDARGGRIIAGSPNIPNWVGAEIAQTLEKRLRVPVLVENDARGMALAEFRFGAGRNVSSTLSLTIGTGVGGAIIIDNQLWRGHSQSAGEIGHAVIDVDGSLVAATRSDATTNEGLKGTLEDLTSARAIERRMRRKLECEEASEVFKEVLAGADPGALVARQVFEAYHLGDQLAIECLRETGEILGKSLAGFVNLLNPEMIIIGGGVIDAVPELVDWVSDKIKSEALGSATSDLKVRKAELGNSAGLLGAALLGQESFWKEILNSKQS